MKQIPIKLGPLALLLTVVSICLTVLSILTFSTARADVRLAERYADMVTRRYALMDEGQKFLKEAGDRLKENGSPAELAGTTADAGGNVWFEKEMDDMKLTVGLMPQDDTWAVREFSVTKEWTEDLDIGNLWTGMPGTAGTAGMPGMNGTAGMTGTDGTADMAGSGKTAAPPGLPGMPGK